jgi:hypothetical protein
VAAARLRRSDSFALAAAVVALIVVLDGSAPTLRRRPDATADLKPSLETPVAG